MHAFNVVDDRGGIRRRRTVGIGGKCTAVYLHEADDVVDLECGSPPVHADTDIYAADILVRDTELKEGRVLAGNPFAKVEVEVLDAGEVAGV